MFSPFFSLEELTATSTGIPNDPPRGVVTSLRALCAAVLVPVREKVGPWAISSGYRSPDVNSAVGGSRTSQHMVGEAADGHPASMPTGDAWLIILDMIDAGLPVDQAIIYPLRGPFIHLSHTQSRQNRRQVLWSTGNGYPEWTTADTERLRSTGDFPG